MDTLVKLLSTQTNVLWSVVISGVMSSLVAWMFGVLSKRWEIRDKVKVDYNHDQRKALFELIGQYKGRLVLHANTFSFRQWNIYKNEQHGWLTQKPGGNLDGYYFKSTVYRFLSLYCFVHKLDAEAILLDPQIARTSDFSLLKYIAAMRWVMTDPSLFADINYDESKPTDHFYTDELREHAQVCWEDDKLTSFEKFKAGPFQGAALQPVLNFFDGLSKGEPRLRWDRLVALHLVLLAFVNSFGYDWQYSDKKKFEEVASKFNHRTVLVNLVHWLGRHHLDEDDQVKQIIKLVK